MNTEQKLRRIIREEVSLLLQEKEDPSRIFRDDLNGMVREYFYRSMSGNWDTYDWEQIAEILKPAFRRKSVEHGFLGWEAYGDFMEQIGMGLRSVNIDVYQLPFEEWRAIPQRLELDNRMWGYHISRSDIYNRVADKYEMDPDDPYSFPTEEDVWIEAMKEHVDRLQQVFGDGVHKDIYEIYKDLKNIRRLSQKEKINLINRAIHAEHETGDVVEDMNDPDDLREDAEKEYQKRRRSKVSRVRNNPNFI
jgi:hypothetical protein